MFFAAKSQAKFPLLCKELSWESWGCYLYGFNHATSISQSVARLQCQQCGGDLVSFASLEEFKFVLAKG